MRAVSVEDPANMQWAIDVITLSNARRRGNQELFEGKRGSCIDKVRELPMTLQVVKRKRNFYASVWTQPSGMVLQKKHWMK